jgi:uncharacterized tellurite resistance protein B-like protein
MTKQERVAIVRLLSDITKADAVIETSEMEMYVRLRNKYRITEELERAASEMSLSTAIRSLVQSEHKDRSAIIEDCVEMAVSNGFCSPSEALLIIAIKRCLGDEISGADEILSVHYPRVDIDKGQVLYVECAYNKGINEEIKQQYRQIYNELRLAGFHFVYVPSFAARCKCIGHQHFYALMRMLAPNLSEKETLVVLEDLASMTTETFCRNYLCDRLGMHSLRDTGPALLLHVGDDYVGGTRYNNFLRIPLQSGVMDSVCRFVEEFVATTSSSVVAVPLANGQESGFPLIGFYRLLVNQFTFREGKRCGLVIDPFRGTLFLPEIQTEIRGLHRKEKAFYAMLVHRTRTGGINFTAPSSKADFQAYERHIRSVKEQFAQWYGLFGGDRSKIPDIENPGIRNPIISVIRTALYNLTPKLLNVKDFNICKSESGSYIVPLDPAAVTIRQFPKENDP